MLSLLFPIVSSLTVGPNLIQNGSFEDSAETVCPRSGANVWCQSTRPEGINPWFVSSANKEYELDSSPIPWQAFHGIWSMDLASQNPYTMSQTVKTEIGKTYTLTVMVNQNRCGTVPVKTGFIQATGSGAMNFSHAPTEGWKLVSYTFTATQSDTIVSIGATGSGSCGPVIDDVQVRRVLKCNA